MKVNELLNLWVCSHREEDFKILVCASDEIEAQDVIKSYSNDTGITLNFEIIRFDDVRTTFDCDHVLFKNQ